MTTSQLSIFCKAIYLRPRPISSQSKFITALFESAGASFTYGDDYGRSLANGSKDLTQDIRNTFPDLINGAEVSEFLRKYLTDTASKPSNLKQRCTNVAATVGLPMTLVIDPEAFILALADWFTAIIKNPEDCDILATAYQRRVEGESAPDIESFAPLYKGDKVIVTKPPSQQTHSAPFWETFSHEWSIQNTGSLAWSNRSLQCMNPNDNGVRAEVVKLAVPDIAPREFAKIRCNFETRGREGRATSLWQMVDDQGNNCFPNHGTTFDVTVAVVNPNAPRNEAR